VGSHTRPTSDSRGMISFGCLGALLMGMFSCCLLGGLLVLPVFSGNVPAPPAADPTRPDLTVYVPESFLRRALNDALPETMSGDASFDIQPGNRLSLQATFDLLLVDIDLDATFGLQVQGGQLQFTVENLEAGGADLGELFGGSIESMTAQMSGIMQEQIEQGLGTGAQILAIETTDQALIIKARWATGVAQ
jgi:hypothetical protein